MENPETRELFAVDGFGAGDSLSSIDYQTTDDAAVHETTETSLEIALGSPSFFSRSSTSLPIWTMPG